MSSLDALAAAWWALVVPASLQLALVALTVWCVLRCLRRAAPGLRLALVGVVLLELAVPAPFSAPTGLLGGRETAPVLATPSFEELFAARVTVRPSSVGTASLGSAPAADAAWARPSWRTLLLLVHAAGALVLLSSWRLEARRLRALRAGSSPPTPSLAAELARTARTLGLRRVPLLVTSPEVPAPACFGLLRPTVLLPAGLEARVGARGMRAVLTHELTHLARRDPLWNALHLLLVCAWWFHPAAWWIGRELRRAQEDACDDAVLRRGAVSPAAYGQSLVAVARELTERRTLTLTLSMARGEHALARRLRRILATEIPRRTPVLHFALPIALALTLVPGASTAMPAQDSDAQAAGVDDPRQVERGLAWLATRQAEDGSIEGAEGSERGATALALLALLGSGQTAGVGPQKEVVARLVGHLERGFAATSGDAPGRDEALAAAALAEHLALAGQDDGRRAAVERALRRIQSAGNVTALDAEVAFWSCLALASARDAGVPVDQEVFAALAKPLPLGATTGAATWDPATTCAASIFLHALTGGDPDDPRMGAAVERVLATVARPPAADPQRVYLGAIALYQVGGDAWRHWNLGPLQRLGPAARVDGGFPPVEGLAGGRVASTALATLALEVHYRYARIMKR